jgi:hypothetical protein
MNGITAMEARRAVTARMSSRALLAAATTNAAASRERGEPAPSDLAERHAW